VSRRFFLVERYAPASGPAAVAAAAQRLPRSADGTRHLGSVVIATEEICLSVFEAPDAGAVAALNDDAGLPIDRIVEAVWFPGSVPDDISES
jgi:Nickel responsive protein SCO4226-like